MNRMTLCFVAASLVAGVVSTSHVAAAAPRPAAPVCPSYRANDQYPLRLCDKGDDVKSIQAALRGAGFSIDVDGYFGPNTLSAVLEFQRRNGLDVDGLVGPMTWSALFPPTPRCDRYTTDATYPLDMCDKGPAVRVAQLFLAVLYAPLDIDGYFGPDTDAAARNFQTEMGLVVDGLVGPRTWRALTAGFTCGTDADRSGVIDPDEVALPSAFTHLANFLAACTR